jgi:hypothetical protein
MAEMVTSPPCEPPTEKMCCPRCGGAAEGVQPRYEVVGVDDDGQEQRRTRSTTGVSFWVTSCRGCGWDYLWNACEVPQPDVRFVGKRRLDPHPDPSVQLELFSTGSDT